MPIVKKLPESKVIVHLLENSTQVEWELCYAAYRACRYREFGYAVVATASGCEVEAIKKKTCVTVRVRKREESVCK